MFQIKEKYTSKTFILGAVTVLSFTIFSAKPAYSTSFSLKFLNDSGQQVGSGDFSYEDNKIKCVQNTPNPSACNPPGADPGNEIFVSNTLNTFSATIYGVSFWKSSTAWWIDPSRNQRAGFQLIIPNKPFPSISIVYDRWFFANGNGPFSYPSISIIIDPISDTLSGKGTWSAMLSPNNSWGSGTFIATNTAIAVPEPLTLLGGMTALGFGVAFKRKIRT